MKSKRIVPPGSRFNNWEVIREVERIHHRRFFCRNIVTGIEKTIQIGHLVSGASKGLSPDQMPKPTRTHGMTRTRIWRIWMGMKARCLNRNEAAYKNYGGRGISICERWMKFENFLEDMSEGYGEKMTIERIDVNKGYFKENCKWIPLQEQGLNRRNNSFLTIKGVTKLVSVWAKEAGITAKTLTGRIKYYKIPEENLLVKKLKRRTFSKRKLSLETRLKISNSHKGKLKPRKKLPEKGIIKFNEVKP